MFVTVRCIGLTALLALFLQTFPTAVHGHASQLDPPGRRTGWWNTVNDCGPGPNNDGVGRRQQFPNGTGDMTGPDCGVCGDSIYIGTTMERNYTTPRACEVGGFYYPSNPVIAYGQNQVITVTIQIGNNHGGRMQWRLCNNDTSAEEQSCFNGNVLTLMSAYTDWDDDMGVVEGDDTLNLPRGIGGMNLLYVKLKLPVGLTCQRCILQFTYLGGANEMFRTCLDVSIRPFHQLNLLQNQGSGKCLRQAFIDKTTTLTSAVCNMEDMEQYVFTLGNWNTLTDGAIYIGSSTYCVDVDAASTAEGASVLRYPCDRSNPRHNQKWSTVLVNVGTPQEAFQIVQTGNSNMCLALTAGSVYQTKCSDEKNQLWRILH